MDEAEQIEELVEHLEQVITMLTQRVNRLEHSTPPTAAPVTLSPPMQVQATPQPLGFYNRMAPMNPR